MLITALSEWKVHPATGRCSCGAAQRKSHYTSQEISDEPQQGNMSTAEPNDGNADNTSVENGEDAILETPDHSKYKILLVEDNEEMLMILKDLFSKTYQVFLARNGQEGLETVRTVAPDLVVSDDDDDYERHRYVQSNQRRPHYLPHSCGSAHRYGLYGT